MLRRLRSFEPLNAGHMSGVRRACLAEFFNTQTPSRQGILGPAPRLAFARATLLRLARQLLRWTVVGFTVVPGAGQELRCSSRNLLEFFNSHVLGFHGQRELDHYPDKGDNGNGHERHLDAGALEQHRHDEAANHSAK